MQSFGDSSLVGNPWETVARAAQALLEVARAALGQGQVFHPHPQAPPQRSLAAVINEFLVAKARAGRSWDYIIQLRVHLSDFAQGRLSRPIGSITLEEIEGWLHRPGWKPRTRLGYLLDLRTLFNFAKRRGYVHFNPADAVESPTVEPTAPRIHSPDQVAEVLRQARVEDPALTRILAIRYFAGLRGSEAAALADSEILLEQGFIEVTAAKSKTRRRRLVTIQPNLRAWLALGGALPIRGYDDRLTAFIGGLEGVEWASNITRHSFCSYHLAAFGNAARTALEAGHSEAMLFANYRELVTPAAAKRYWEIRPDVP